MKAFWAPVVGLVAILSFNGSANAAPKDDLESGVKAYQSGDFAASFAFALKAARANFGPAFEAVAVHYLNGTGVQADNAKAAFWAKKAAASGSPYGHYLLGSLYANGQGVTQSNYLAIVHAQQALRGGYRNAEKLITFIAEYEGANSTTCMKYGFAPSSSEYGSCIMQLDLALQKAQFAEQQYQLQLQQYQQQAAAYEAQQKAIKAERERRKWEMLGRLGAGMANSTSPTFLGALNEGLAAANGIPIARPAPEPPSPPTSGSYTVRLPNGTQVYCNYSSGYMDCR